MSNDAPIPAGHWHQLSDELVYGIGRLKDAAPGTAIPFGDIARRTVVHVQVAQVVEWVGGYMAAAYSSVSSTACFEYVEWSTAPGNIERVVDAHLFRLTVTQSGRPTETYIVISDTHMMRAVTRP